MTDVNVIVTSVPDDFSLEDAEQESVQALQDVPKNEPPSTKSSTSGDQRAVRLAYEVEIVIDGVRKGVALRQYG